MSRPYTKIHPKYINGRPRNEPIPMENGELGAMTAEIRSVRYRDGKTRKERRAAYVRERTRIHDAEWNDGDPV